MRRKFLVISLLVGLVLVMSGCMDVNTPISAEETGFWNRFFVWPMSSVLTFFANMFNGSYGWSIIVVTLIVRLLLLPLNLRQLRSSRTMQDIQPQLLKLQEKYSSKDAATQQKLQEETMALFQKNNVNPLAGCLPIFVQMPILISMYQAIMRTEEIASGGDFLWFSLGSPDPYYILPLITGAATYLQQRLTMANNTGPANPQMTAMLYMMPIMITVMSIFFPSALALYWVVGNVFMVVQTLLINNPMRKKADTGGVKK